MRTTLIKNLPSLSFGLAISSLTLPALAAVPIDTGELRDAVTREGVRQHQEEFQAIAGSYAGTRAAGTPGHVYSAEYVIGQLKDAGYAVDSQEFDFTLFEITGTPILEQIAPNPENYVNSVDFDVMEYSGSGDITAAVTAVDVALGAGNNSTSGCEAADFAGFTAGDIALIQRGTCTFQIKADNAAAAGAAGVIIFNQGNTADRTGIINGTLGEDYSGALPVFDITYALGAELATTAGLVMHLAVDTSRETVETFNVIAETIGGRDDRVVLVGAHLDSVPEGPGINDNGSGSATILEVALQMAELGIDPVNKVRFAWWSAEEAGLIGSQYYADQLSARDIKDIAVNLNFDMVGSPNFVRFVYDGDGSASDTAGPNGSKNIEKIFADYFTAQGLAFEPTAFDGRSDYGPFIAVGIPAGGLFTGAEEIKTAEEAVIYGGTAGDAYDPCYHRACDTYSNNSDEALDQMADATAHAVLTFAMTTAAVNGTDKGSKKARKMAENLEFWGSHRRK